MRGVGVFWVAACTLLLGCTPHSSDSEATIVLRSLDGASVSDTLMVKAKLPCMPQLQEARYHIQNRTNPMQSESIYLTDVIASDYKIVALETSEDCLVGYMSDVVKDDSLLFVVDGWNKYIYCFDLNGKYLRRIGRKGHAADEYVNMMRVAFDKKNKRVCVYDGDSQKLVFYDYQGKFLGRESLYFEFSHMAISDDGRRVFLTLPYEHPDYPSLDSYRLMVTDEKGVPQCGVLSDIGFPKYGLGGSQFNSDIDDAFHSTPDGVYYIDILSPDTIWRVGKKECVPFLAADFGEPFTTLESYREMTSDGYFKRMNQVMFMQDDFVFAKDFGYLNVNYGKRAIVNFKTGKYVIGELCYKPGVPCRNFLEFTYASYPNDKVFLYDWEDDQMVKVWDAAELKRRLKVAKESSGWEGVYDSWPQSDRDILDRLTPEDNPVLVVATFKDF